MPKQKKTRKQKILADKRHATENLALYSLTPPTQKSPVPQPISLEQTAATISTKSYQYLATDLQKTALFTCLVVLVEVIIYYFL